ncbi:Bug family tripartite tricarboxylate transporter substrate binding protein [Cupriavidus taiwanensis]|uniref:Bug family tripartite tricarboxylate transporter substrate binding protein n=1 Tax=Cupriavidus taiwanensis TaxID=164546 RepID=UPI000E10570E|nr:tripartite tricarboxylate transporter substrate binding protein [Cupriavidus taiwanensis]SPA56024.1 putative extra-cytoplasmic solute receptor [Cupriavidus taiwanensis]
MTRLIAFLPALAALASLATAPAQAQDTYPSRPVRLIVNFPAGGPLDTVARLIAERAGRDLRQPVVVENRAGAGGNVGAEAAARATPDGYTLLMSTDTLVTVNPFAYRKMAFDPVRDLQPIGLAGTFNQVLVTHPDLKAGNLNQFLALARSKDLSYASAGIASPGHIAFEMLKVRTRIPATHVPYKGNAPALSDVLAGQVPAGFLATPTAVQYIRSGKLVPLAVSGHKRDPLLPDVPTVAEAGVAGFDAEFAFVMLAPAGMPAPIRARWEQELKSIFADAGFQRTLAAQGVRPQASDGAQAAQWLSAGSKRWGELIRKLGVSLD